MGTHIYQIFYSSESRRKLDSGFIALDNTENLRPDWREYWPIRNWLLNNSLNDDDYYGFFSPKFQEKTGLQASQVKTFIDQCSGLPDIILFSPFFDHSAYCHNVFVQFQVHNAGNHVMQESIKHVSPTMWQLMDSAIMDSRNTVFCNYFVAKKRFWKLWLEKCEMLFAVAEDGTTPLGALLNSTVQHDGGQAPNKVFVIERIASWLMVTHRIATKAFNPWNLPHSNSAIADFRSELIQMDALKIAMTAQGYRCYHDEFEKLRTKITTMALAKKGIIG